MVGQTRYYDVIILRLLLSGATVHLSNKHNIIDVMKKGSMNFQGGQQNPWHSAEADTVVDWFLYRRVSVPHGEDWTLHEYMCSETCLIQISARPIEMYDEKAIESGSSIYY